MTPYIRTALPSDARWVGERMRVRDIAEVRAASGEAPLQSVESALRSSALAWTVCAPDGEPTAVAGVTPFPALGPDAGCPWLLATDKFRSHIKFVLRETPKYIEQMHRRFPVLLNYVDCRHGDSLRYLRRAGFQFTAFDPEFGFERRPFIQFSRVHHVSSNRSHGTHGRLDRRVVHRPAQGSRGAD